MTRSLPAALLPPARVDLFRGDPDPQRIRAASDAEPDLSLTVTIEDRARHAGRRFAFQAARWAEAEALRHGAVETQGAGLITDERETPATILDQRHLRSYAPFLAGAIAQARPGTVLHNPPFREASVAYRRSGDLGVEDRTPGVRSDKRV